MDISDKIKSHWYVLQIMSGQEKRAQEALQLKREEAAREGIDNGVDDVRIPMDLVEVTRVKKERKKVEKAEDSGKPKKSSKKEGVKAKEKEKEVKPVYRKRYPGYMLLQARLFLADGNINPSVWDLVKNTQGVIGFVGGDHPVMLSESESAEMLRSDEEESTAKKPKVLFSVGEEVIVKSGAFMGQKGIITSIDKEHAILGLAVEFMGRTSRIDLPNSGVEKEQ